MMTYITLFPTSKIMLYMIVPIPAVVFGVGYVLYECYGSYMGGRNIGAC